MRVESGIKVFRKGKKTVFAAPKRARREKGEDLMGGSLRGGGGGLHIGVAGFCGTTKNL
jgi:hypothetical protein